MMNHMCSFCGGLIMEAGKTYGYGGKVCDCPKTDMAAENKAYQRGLLDGIKQERERCARICAEQERLHQMTDDKAAIRQVLYAIRAEAGEE
jgi:hypothetical protein